MKPFVALCLAAVSLGAQAAMAETQGQLVFQKWCEPCHGRASHLPATAALAVKYKGKIAAALQDRKDLTATTLKTFVRQGVLSMPPFRKTEISDADLDALTLYLTAKKPR